MLYSIADLQEIEERIARLVTEFMAAADKGAWVRAYFGDSYSEDVTGHEMVSDVVSRELNRSFTSVFKCPHCGRFAMKHSDEQEWQFFEAVRHGG